MVALDEELAFRGLKIIGFPCNQFKAQEPGTDAEIKTFVTEKFGVKFQMMSKIDVNAQHVHPVFAWLRRSSDMWNGTQASVIPWNFSKFIVDRDGKLVKHYDQKPSPMEFKGELEALLE
jgi:glutathione peroxidase